MNIFKRLEALFAAVAFAESGEHDTALYIAGNAPEKKARETKRKKQDQRPRLRV